MQPQSFNMTRTTLIVADLVFVVVMVLIYNNGDLQKYPVILAPFVIAALVTCVIRHINYYHMTKRIY
jgi:hypothetical protein